MDNSLLAVRGIDHKYNVIGRLKIFKIKKRILAYRTGSDRLLERPGESTHWTRALSEHLQQVAFFHHDSPVMPTFFRFYTSVSTMAPLMSSAISFILSRISSISF